MTKKFFTDFERMEYVKKFRTSGLSLRRFAMMHGVNRETLRDWVNAYQDLEGEFIRLDFDSDEAGAIYTAKLFSIIRTAIINGLDPYRYIKYVLENVRKKPIDDLLPYSRALEISD